MFARFGIVRAERAIYASSKLDHRKVSLFGYEKYAC